LLVGGDPGGPPGGHLLDAVEVAKQQAGFELVTATHAPLVILLLSEVAITTVGAHPGTHEGQLSSGGDAALIPDGQDRPLHPVGAALVVDDRPRPELAQPEEPGPGQEGLPDDLLPAGRDVSQERQAREVIARQEAFAGEVPVGVA